MAAGQSARDLGRTAKLKWLFRLGSLSSPEAKRLGIPIGRACRRALIRTCGWAALQAGVCSGAAVRNDDLRGAVLADKLEQSARVRGAQADATVTRRTAKLADGGRAVDGKSAVEEQRVRHRRHVIFARTPHALHALHIVAPRRGLVTCPRR